MTYLLFKKILVLVSLIQIIYANCQALDWTSFIFQIYMILKQYFDPQDLVIFFIAVSYQCCYYWLGINDQGLYRTGGVSSKVQKLLSLMIGEFSVFSHLRYTNVDKLKLWLVKKKQVSMRLCYVWN